jgi:hypothetical protein
LTSNSSHTSCIYGCKFPTQKCNTHALHVDKQRFKTMYLDAVGEAQNSPRRSSVRGMWGSHVLQATGGGPEVEVLMNANIALHCATLNHFGLQHFESLFPSACLRHQLYAFRGSLLDFSIYVQKYLNDDYAFLIQVFLLDERYDRSPLPCWTRRAYCESVRYNSIAL